MYGKVTIGYSAWNRRVDSPNWCLGKKIALERAQKYAKLKEYPDIPFSVMKKLPDFIFRCGRYFKNATFVDWVYCFLLDYADPDELPCPE